MLPGWMNAQLAWYMLAAALVVLVVIYLRIVLYNIYYASEILHAENLAAANMNNPVAQAILNGPGTVTTEYRAEPKIFGISLWQRRTPRVPRRTGEGGGDGTVGGDVRRTRTERRIPRVARRAAKVQEENRKAPGTHDKSTDVRGETGIDSDTVIISQKNGEIIEEESAKRTPGNDKTTSVGGEADPEIKNTNNGNGKNSKILEPALAGGAGVREMGETEARIESACATTVEASIEQYMMGAVENKSGKQVGTVNGDEKQAEDAGPANPDLKLAGKAVMDEDTDTDEPKSMENAATLKATRDDEKKGENTAGTAFGNETVSGPRVLGETSTSVPVQDQDGTDKIQTAAAAEPLMAGFLEPVENEAPWRRLMRERRAAFILNQAMGVVPPAVAERKPFAGRFGARISNAAASARTAGVGIDANGGTLNVELATNGRTRGLDLLTIEKEVNKAERNSTDKTEAADKMAEARGGSKEYINVGRDNHEEVKKIRGILKNTGRGEAKSAVATVETKQVSDGISRIPSNQSAANKNSQMSANDGLVVDKNSALDGVGGENNERQAKHAHTTTIEFKNRAFGVEETEENVPQRASPTDTMHIGGKAIARSTTSDPEASSKEKWRCTICKLPKKGVRKVMRKIVRKDVCGCDSHVCREGVNS